MIIRTIKDIMIGGSAMKVSNLVNKIPLFLILSALILPVNASCEKDDSDKDINNIFSLRVKKGADLSEAKKIGGDYLKLDKIDPDNKFPLIKALSKRRSKRDFSDEELSINELSMILWACQGITEPGRGFRTAPSAGATYPIELYVVLRQGVYGYDPKEHALSLHQRGDLRKKLSNVALGQRPIAIAPAVLVFCYNPQKIVWRYGARSLRYAYIETGHIAQNALLAATSLDLGAVPIGAFDDNKVKAVLELKNDVLYLLPIGRAR
jgi:SagB-type dehydrogenase family enzyme